MSHIPNHGNHGNLYERVIRCAIAASNGNLKSPHDPFLICERNYMYLYKTFQVKRVCTKLTNLPQKCFIEMIIGLSKRQDL